MKYFSEKELKIADAPQSVKENMNKLVKNILDPLRERVGAVQVTSGYRTKDYNKLIGGAWNSQHCLGQACDIVPLDEKNIMKVFVLIVNLFDYDQVIYEQNDQGSVWVHVSYNKGKNRKHNGKWVYRPYK